METVTATQHTQWMSKQQAAAAIGVSTKTIEKYAKKEQIEFRRIRRDAKSPWMVEYNPEDVARVRTERDPEAGPLRYGETVTVLPPETWDSKSALTELVARLSAHQEALLERFSEHLKAIAPPALPEPSQNSLGTALYLSIEEARRYTGLSEKRIQAAAREGKVARIGRKYRRQDLDKL